MINFFYNEDPEKAQNEIAVGYVGTQKLYRITKKEEGKFLAEKKKKNGQWISIASCAHWSECEQQCIKYALEKAVALGKNEPNCRRQNTISMAVRCSMSMPGKTGWRNQKNTIKK